MNQKRWITPCGRETNSRGEYYNKQSWAKHVESCHSQECVEYMRKLRASISYQSRYYMQGDPEWPK